MGINHQINQTKLYETFFSFLKENVIIEKVMQIHTMFKKKMRMIEKSMELIIGRHFIH